MDPLWTLAVCTRNRAAVLARCLQAIKALSVPPGLEYEVLVVLNDCTDDSHEVAEAAGIPHLRVAAAVTPGIARARNVAVEQATARHLAFIDDDIMVPPDYLVKLDRARAQDPDCAAFAGPIRPEFDDPPPTWVLEAGQFDVSRPAHGEFLSDAEIVRGFLVDYELGGVSRRYGFGNMRPFSANMAFNLEAVRALGPGPYAAGGPFVPQLGKGGDWEILGEDTEIWMRLEQFKRPRRYVHELEVRHLHFRERLTVPNLLRWCWQRGATLTFLRYVYPPLFGIVPGFDMLAARMTAGPASALPLGPLPELIRRTAEPLGEDPAWEQLAPHVAQFDRLGRHYGLSLIHQLNNLGSGSGR